MQFNFGPFQEKSKEIEAWLSKELRGIRTSRATPALLDSILVESYGAKIPLKQVAAISVEDPRTLRVSPWDASVGKEIEKAITLADLGLSVSSDERGARVSFPELTRERRESLVRIMKEKREQAKVSLRKLRDETIRQIEAAEKAGGMGEDEKFRHKKELEKLSEEAGKRLDDSTGRKEKEILA